MALRVGQDGRGRKLAERRRASGGATCCWLAAAPRADGFGFRPARNNQLRTGTDKGNPTV